MVWQPVDFKSARVRARLTQTDVAKHIGVSQSTIARFEDDTLDLPEEKKLELLSFILLKQKGRDEQSV